MFSVRPLFRRTAAALMLGLLTVGLLTPSPSHAAGTCAANPSDFTCNYKDPQDEGCNTDAITVESRPIYDQVSGAVLGKVVLKASPTCKTMWARVVYNAAVAGDVTVASLTRADGLVTNARAEGDRNLSSPMFYAVGVFRSVQAGGQIDPAGSAFGSALTGWYAFSS